MLTVTWCHPECFVPSGLDFKVSGGLYYLFINLLRGHQIAVNVTCTLLWLNVETLKRATVSKALPASKVATNVSLESVPCGFGILDPGSCSLTLL